jgi:hypothetical protein
MEAPPDEIRYISKSYALEDKLLGFYGVRHQMD